LLLNIRVIRVIRGLNLFRMLELDKVTCADFAACLNQDFEIVFPDGTLSVKLSEARPWGPPQPANVRQPFNLTFVGPTSRRLPQGTYKFRHAALGEMEIFIVPISADKGSAAYEAVFN
jgi:hypothetical protein